MLPVLAKNWWVVAIRGIAAIAFGILAFAWPGITLLTMVYLFGAYALVDGAFQVYAAIRGAPSARGHRILIGTLGTVGIIAGIVAFVYPGLTALTLLYVIAVWAIIIGALQIWTAIRLRREIEGEWLMVLGGVFAILFGLLLIASPGSGILSVLFIVAVFAIVYGVLLLGLAWRLRGLNKGGMVVVGT